jgi:hypothetical protein
MATWDTDNDEEFKNMVEDGKRPAVVRDLTPGRRIMRGVE